MQIHELNNFTGTLGSGAYLAIDDGTDTGKISSEGLLAATEARIDNIIAGPAPSAEEIVDARLGADGVTYPTLGDAIRDQFTDVKSDLTSFIDESFDTGTVDNVTTYTDSNLTWNQGVKYYNGNEYTGSSYAHYHYCYFNVQEGDVIAIKDTTKKFRDRCEFLNNVVVSATNMTSFNSYTVPSGVDKVALTRVVSDTSDITLTRDNTVYYLKDDAIPQNFDALVNGVIGNYDFPKVEPKGTTFFHISDNLIDPSSFTDGKYVNNVTGAINDAPTWAASDYISISPNTSYAFGYKNGGHRYIRYAIYNANKENIAGAGNYVVSLEDMIFTTPLNGAYIRCSFDKNYVSSMTLVESEEYPTFEPYSAYVMPEYILKTTEEITMNLPAKIYALIGYELNVYFENLVEDWTKYSWDVTCSKGMQLDRGYRVTPVSGDEGTYTLTITAHSENGSKSMTASLIITSESAGSGESETIMILGDSTTNNGIAVTKLNANFADDVMSITTVGTRGTSPNKHEGRSGWTFNAYFNPPNAGDIALGVENPWYNPASETFDASYYFTETGVTKPDWFIINLGINDVFSYSDDTALEGQITTCKNLCDEMIASMNEASPDTKIAICLTIPPNHSQDAFGKAYNCGQYRDRYKRNNLLWVNALIAEYDERESEGIYLIPIYANLDTVYNMGMETLPVNARNTAITYQSPIANGGVHPVESGYWQIADVYTAFIKGNV